MPPRPNKRLLLISHHNSYRIAPYIKAALNLNIDVTIASEGQHSLVTEVANGIHINFDDTKAALASIIDEHNNRAFSGILGSDDQTVELAALAAKTLKLPHNPPEAAKFSHRKDLARAQLTLSHCNVPNHCLLDIKKPLKQQITDLPWPCVLKPLNMSASRGVIRVNNQDEFLAACERLRPILADAKNAFEQTHILVEEYIDGFEIAYEGYLQNGTLKTITIFDKPDPLSGPYFEETIYVTPSLLNTELQQKIKDVIESSCKAYGLFTGSIHAECRIDKTNKVWILEIASRTIGGDCSKILSHEGFNLEELAVLLSIGQDVEVNMPEQARAVMMIPVKQKGLLKRVEGLLAAKKIEHIDSIDIIVNQGHELIPLPEGNQYLGYIFASAEAPDQVVSAIRQAYDKLDFITAPIFKIN